MASATVLGLINGIGDSPRAYQWHTVTILGLTNSIRRNEIYKISREENEDDGETDPQEELKSWMNAGSLLKHSHMS